MTRGIRYRYETAKAGATSRACSRPVAPCSYFPDTHCCLIPSLARPSLFAGD